MVLIFVSLELGKALGEELEEQSIMNFIMRDKNHCFVNDFFGSHMGVGVAVRASTEIIPVILVIFT